MAKKSSKREIIERRQPRQARAQQKVELMLEAAMRLLVDGDIESLTTNAVALKAGVSIGTLYQYFDSKESLLDALAQQELGAMAAQVLGTLQAGPTTQQGDRIRRIVRVVIGSYGGRTRVHRLLMHHALTHRSNDRLSSLYNRLMIMFTTEGVAVPGQSARKLSQAQAFVITHSIAGVLRALTASSEVPPLRGIEDALVQMTISYIESLPPS